MSDGGPVRFVVVFTADLPLGSDADLIPLQELLNQYILPAVKSVRPLPANPNGLAGLEASIQALAQPQRTAPPPLPAVATEISGKTYALENNPFGWDTLVINFQDGAGEVRATINGTLQLTIGLDNIYRSAAGGDSTLREEFRGRWENQDTLVVDDIVLGQMMRTTTRIQFSGSAIHLTWQEKFSGNRVEIQGALTPPAK